MTLTPMVAGQRHPAVVLNGVVFFFPFQPLLAGGGSLPVPVLEALVVLVALNPFQGDGHGFSLISALRVVLAISFQPNAQPGNWLPIPAQASCLDLF